MFFAAAYWRGRLNVGSMRSFKTEKEARAYAKKLGSQYRVYELSSDDKPRLVESA